MKKKSTYNISSRASRLNIESKDLVDSMSNQIIEKKFSFLSFLILRLHTAVKSNIWNTCMWYLSSSQRSDNFVCFLFIFFDLFSAITVAHKNQTQDLNFSCSTINCWNFWKSLSLLWDSFIILWYNENHKTPE